MTDHQHGVVEGGKTYDLGHAAAEVDRLRVQAAVMAPITRRLFEEAGIARACASSTSAAAPGTSPSC